MVPVARAHEPARRADRRGRRRRVRRGGVLSGALGRLAAVVEDEGGLLAEALTGARDGDERLGALVSSGPRAATDPEEYALLVEAIREGALLHYGTGRVVDPADPDLALLAGDRLYAIGLDRLARLGDVEAVAALADVISGVARAEAEEEPARAESAWESGVHAVGGIVLRPNR